MRGASKRSSLCWESSRRKQPATWMSLTSMALGNDAWNTARASGLVSSALMITECSVSMEVMNISLTRSLWVTVCVGSSCMRPSQPL